MAARGNVGLTIKRPRPWFTRSDLTLQANTFGGNIASNTSDPGALDQTVILLGANSTFIRRAISNSSGIWTFYDLSTGTYTVQEFGKARVWLVVVDAAGAVTVSRILSGGGSSIGYAG